MERLNTELELLRAMYPDQIEWSEKRREVRFMHDEKASIVLRLPENYPDADLPGLISVTDASKQDVRQQMSSLLPSLQLTEGEEVLDAIIQAYQDLLTNNIPTVDATEADQRKHDIEDENKTVIIWLHHLLATTKRKLALSPTLTAPPSVKQVSGLTKPGYPGVMLFSGPSMLVDAHVAELKRQKWQAFQVRFEEGGRDHEPWTFRHGQGVKEVETMSEIVQGIVEEGDQTAFLKAVGVK